MAHIFSCSQSDSSPDDTAIRATFINQVFGEDTITARICRWRSTTFQIAGPHLDAANARDARDSLIQLCHSTRLPQQEELAKPIRDRIERYVGCLQKQIKKAALATSDAKQNVGYVVVDTRTCNSTIESTVIDLFSAYLHNEFPSPEQWEMLHTHDPKRYTKPTVSIPAVPPTNGSDFAQQPSTL